MPVESRILGRTGLKVSILGLGGGGNSRLGLSNGQTEAHAAEVIRVALDLGVTLIDTARVYQTERAVGQATKGRRRDQVVISSKSPYLNENGTLFTPQQFQANLDLSLRDLGLEMIDVYFIHGLQLSNYEDAVDRFVPVLERARQVGKIRFFGVTEAFERDTRHEMMQKAVQDDHWDVVMVGFNIINPSARDRVLAWARQKGIGTMGMFAVRRGLINETWLRVLLKRLAENGEIDHGLTDAPDLLEALGLRGAADTLSEAAYRFCAFEPGIDCVFSGTSSAEHLRMNLDAVKRGKLPAAALQRLDQLFGKVDSISGQVR